MNTIPTWQVEHIRFSLLGTVTGQGSGMWERLVGSPPESSTNRPAQRMTIEEGAWSFGRLTINEQPGRIDVVLSASAPHGAAAPTLGVLPDVVETFRSLLVSAKFPQAQRLAIGISADLLCESESDAVGRFKELVPSLAVGKGTDLTVQMNIAKKYPKIGGLRINRLARWAQMLWQVVEFQMQSGQEGQPGAPVDTHIIKLELDFNTANGSALPHASSYGQIISLLLDEAVIVAKEGFDD